MTLGELKQMFHKALTASYPIEEVDALFFMSIEALLNYSRIDYMLDSNKQLASASAKECNALLNALQKGKPIQHIIGSTEFYGLEFKVNQHTLIPRPETEELVALILKEQPQKELTLLDIGTGTGCIPLSLKHHRPNWKVISCDVSEKALQVAKINAKNLLLDIELMQLDILNIRTHGQLPKCQIIVSNPPYVTEQEKELMHKNVLNFDPHLALFVPNNDALKFYSAITKLAADKLHPNGTLYFEINEAFGNEMIALLESHQFTNINLIKDINGKNRIITGQMP